MKQNNNNKLNLTEVTIRNIPIKYKLVSSVAIMVTIQALTNSAVEVDLHN